MSQNNPTSTVGIVLQTPQAHPVILSHGYTVAMDKPTTTCDACGKRYEFTSHKDRCPHCCPKPAPVYAIEDYELVDEVYDDDAQHQGA